MACVARIGGWALFGAVMLIVAVVGADRWVPSAGMTKLVNAHSVCPKSRPVYVSAYERDGVRVRAHCREKPGRW